MNLNEMSVEELEQRKAAISTEIDAPETDVDALLEEVRSINAELERRKALEAQREEVRSAVANGMGEVRETVIEEVKMEKSVEEIRNSKEYIDAYANYIKTGDATECRTLLSSNATGGTVAVPDFVYEEIKTAWEEDEILGRVKKTFAPGNMGVTYEVSASGATNHAEGGDPVSEETLVLATVRLLPVSVKKWIGVTDEAMDMAGREFLQYVISELKHQIIDGVVKNLLDNAIAIAAGSATGPAVGTVASAPTVYTVAQALGQLSGRAKDPIVIMTRDAWAAFKSAQAQAPYAYDPFEGLKVAFVSDDVLGAYTGADEGDVYAIVADVNYGALANFPAGDDVKIKIDETTLMADDVVRILGRMFVGIGVVAPKAFCVIAVPEA